MKRARIVQVWCLILVLAAPGVARAHHSAAPHFDMYQQIEVTGTVVRFEARNPHSFLHVRVTDQSGKTTTWKIELNGIANLLRNGIALETFKAGQRVTVDARPHRRIPNEGLFVAAHMSDGRTVVASPEPLRTVGAAPSLAEPDSIDGIWVRKGAAPQGPNPTGNAVNPNPNGNMLAFLTQAGKRGHVGYDPYRDDPARRCSPVNPTRLWGTPNSPSEIRHQGDRIVIRFEFMDAERVVYLNQAAHPASGPQTVLGHSIGRFEGDTLIVDTANFAPGVILQYGQDTTGKIAGVLHSDAYHMTERLSVNPQTHELEVSWTQDDPKYFTRSFSAEPRPFVRRSDLTLSKYNCQPDKD